MAAGIFCAILTLWSGAAIVHGAGSGAQNVPQRMHIVVLPPDNISGTGVPLKDIRNGQVDFLRSKGYQMDSEEELYRVMEANTIRYIAGIDQESAEVFRKELMADAVLITLVTLYQAEYPPKMALTARLVSTGADQEILWMDSASFSGDESPGLLKLGIVKDARTVRDRTIVELMGSLVRYLDEGKMEPGHTGSLYRPKITFKSPQAGVGLRESEASFRKEGSSGGEGISPAVLYVSLDPPGTRRVLVDYLVTGGTATRGADYKLENGTLRFEPGDTVKTIEMKIVNDDVHEDNETVSIKLLNREGAVMGPHAFHTYTIVDDDPLPAVSFEREATAVPEDRSVVRIGLALDRKSERETSVEYVVTGGGTATKGQDHTLQTGTAVFKPGETRQSMDFNVINDGVHETDETIIVGLGRLSNALLGPIPIHIVTIRDNDPLPAIIFAGEGGMVEEGIGSAKIGVVLSEESGMRTTVDYAVTGGSATNGKDYRLKGGTLVFEPGETVKTIDVGIDDDALDEDDETVEVRISNAVNAAMGTGTVHVLTIGDNDPVPAVSFGVAGQEVREDGGVVAVRVELSGESGKDVTVPFTVGGSAQEGGDYRVMTASPLRIAAGEMFNDIPISVMDNRIYEDGKTMELSLGTPVNATTGVRSAHRVTVKEDDAPPSVAFVLKESAGDEGISPAKIEVSLSAASGKRATVEYAVTGGTAAKGKDYRLRDGVLVFEPGETVKTIEMEIVDDTLYEDKATIEVGLANPKDAVPGETMAYTYTIVEDDPPPVVGFAKNSAEGGEKTGPVKIEVSLSGASGKRATVEYAVTGGTATKGKDYRLRDGMLVFEPGETVKTIEMEIVDDTLYEDNETVEIALDSPAGSTMGERVRFRSVITDDDPPPSVSFGQGGFMVSEGAGKAVIEVVLSGATEKKASIDYIVTGGTARNGIDYVLKAGGLDFAPGEAKKAFEVDIIADTLDEAQETIEVTLLNPVNAVIGEPPVHRVVLEDDDPEPEVSFSVHDQTVEAMVGAAVVSVQLDRASGKDVLVPFTLDGTARKGADYRVMSPNPVTIRAGRTVADVTVELDGNSFERGSRTIDVSIGDAVNAVRGDGGGHVITMRKSDRRPVIAVLPFNNNSSREYAGDIVMLHFVDTLVKLDAFRVVEPGRVRKELLNYRMIMFGGLSVPQADIIFDNLYADLIVTGEVMDYYDTRSTAGAPTVGFSVQVLEKKSRRVLWSSSSYNEGIDGVVLFDFGKINTAHRMASHMVLAIGNMLIK